MNKRRPVSRVIRTKPAAFVKAGCCAMVFVSTATSYATDYTHTGTTSANWSVPTDWNPTAPSGGPNAAGDIVRYQGAASITTTIASGSPVTTGNIFLQGANNTSWTITPTAALTLNNSGAGATINNTNTNTGTTQALILAAGTLTLADNLTISNTGGSTNVTGAIQIASTMGGTGNVTFSNVNTAISQTGSLRLTGTNTYAGTVLVQKGTVSFSTTRPFGASTNTVTLGQNGQGSAAILTTAGNMMPYNFIVASGSGGMLTLGGTNTGASTYSGTVTLNGDVNLNSEVTSTSGLNFSNTISGAGSATKTGTGILQLSKANTFQGTFTASTGTTNLSIAGALGGVSGVSVASAALLQTSTTGLTGTINSTAAVTVNGTLDISGGTETVGSLAGTTTGAFLTIGKNVAANGSFTVGGDNTSTSFSGVIRDGATGAGTTSFTKQGTGTLTLSNANTYSGSTSLIAGKLLVANTASSATGTSTVSIGTAGTLASGAGTTGIITGLVTTAGTGSTIAPGATATANTGMAGTMTLSGGLNAALGGTFVFDLGSASKDLIALGSGVFTAPTAANSGLLGFNFNNLGGITEGTSYQLLTYGSMLNADAGDFTALTLPSGFGAASFTVSGTEVDVSFTAVPEPATVAAGLLALGTLGWSQRRRLGAFGAARRRLVPAA